MYTGQGRKEWVIEHRFGGKDTRVEIRVSSKVINLSMVGIFAGWVGVVFRVKCTFQSWSWALGSEEGLSASERTVSDRSRC